MGGSKEVELGRESPKGNRPRSGRGVGDRTPPRGGGTWRSPTRVGGKWSVGEGVRTTRGRVQGQVKSFYIYIM